MLTEFKKWLARYEARCCRQSAEWLEEQLDAGEIPAGERKAARAYARRLRDKSVRHII